MKNNSNVIPFRPRTAPTSRPALSDFALLTALVIRDRRRRGEIDADTAAAYLAAIGAPQ